MAGQVYENQTFSGSIDNPGGVFINCTFQAGTVVSGDGITFENPSFNGNCNTIPPQPVLVTGTGSVVEGGSSQCTTFGAATVIGYTHVIGGTVLFGPFSNVQGGNMKFVKPVLNTNQACSTEVGGANPPEIKEFCWSMNKTDETQCVESSRDAPAEGGSP